MSVCARMRCACVCVRAHAFCIGVYVDAILMCPVLFHPCPCKAPDERVLVASETLTLFMLARNAGGTHASSPAFLQVEPAVSCD